MEKLDIEKASPLYDFWRSDQDDADEKKRLLIANFDSKAVYLFEKEPYKWESLFQSITRELINGDEDSVKGMQILLSTVSMAEQQKIIDYFIRYKFFNEFVLTKLKEHNNKKPSKRNIFRTLRILFVIFFNPYGISIKGNKNHIYEKSGFFINAIRHTIDNLINIFK